jgi:MinD superfamily P-loop ATPase
MISEDVQVNQVNEFFKTHRKNYEEFVNSEIDKIEPEKCSFCQICKWQEEL